MEENKYPIKKTNKYFMQEVKDLDDYISQVRIDPVKEKKIKGQVLIKMIKDGVLESFSLGKLIKKILEWNDDASKIIREKKKEALLADYFSKTKENEDSIRRLKNFLTNPAGNIIFNKILMIIDNELPDAWLFHHLSNVLINIIKFEKFDVLFEKHRYVLSQIERLSPQALTILSDYEDWSDFQLENVVAFGGEIRNDWTSAFVKQYSIQKKVSDPEKIMRIKYCFKELQQSNFIAAQIISRPDKIRITPTAAGNEIIEYINID